MRFLSLCSGIEAASVAWAPMGWEAVAFAEIESFPSAVLAHHYPDVPNLGDITKFKEWPDFGPVDIVCGGTPCQSFSVAGLRKGLADPRGNLSLTFLAIVDRYRPRYVVWENVPGVLSDDGGRSFASIVGSLGQLGYGWAFRVLDAQYCRVDGFPRAVPQRRRRVFVVGYLGDWRRAAAVLSEPESVLGNTPPRRETGQGVAAGALAGTSPGGGWRIGPDEAAAHHIVAEVAATLPSGGNSTGGDRQPGTSAETAGSMLIAFNSREDPETTWDRTGSLGASSPQAQAIAYSIMPQNSSKDYKAREVDVAQPLMAGGPVGGNQGGDYLLQPVAYDLRGREGGSQMEGPHDTANIRASSGGSSRSYVVAPQWAVRRLTPTECERLQGFPDGYSAIPYRGKPAADGPRYKAIGNSWAVNVARWVGRRIEMVERLSPQIGDNNASTQARSNKELPSLRRLDVTEPIHVRPSGGHGAVSEAKVLQHRMPTACSDQAGCGPQTNDDGAGSEAQRDIVSGLRGNDTASYPSQEQGSAEQRAEQPDDALRDVSQPASCGVIGIAPGLGRAILQSMNITPEALAS